MIKKLAILLGIAGLGALCAGLAACSNEKSELDKYDVLVYYDANGGVYQGQDTVSLADGFNFSDYEADGEGNYHFKLTEPTSTDRTEKIRLTKDGSFFAGWYKTRDIVTEADGSIKDADGRLLKEEDKNYYVVNEDGEYLDNNGSVLIKRGSEYYVINTDTRGQRVISDPVYEYDGYWDFENDTFECAKTGDRKLTLYAGWVPYYTFEYYVNQDGYWTKYDETYFDYKTANAPDSAASDLDTLWIPEWSNGVMEHKHSEAYTFPEIKGSTFVAAYTDEECTQKIESSLKHEGTLDVAHAEPINRVQKIYVEFENVQRYRIENAEQLANNPNLSGYYTIMNDLVFPEVSDTVKWPALFMTGTFRGEFCAAEGKTVTITNANATLTSETAAYGGLFGKIAEGAKVSGITFADVNVSFSKTGRNQQVSVGTFAGEIEEGALVSDVKVSGTLILGELNNQSVCTVHMLVGSGERSGVTTASGGIKLQVCGQALLGGVYSYSVDVGTTEMRPDGTVVFGYASFENSRREKAIEDINTFGGN